MGRNRVIEVLPQALEECQRRFMNPFQKYLWTKVYAGSARKAWEHHSHWHFVQVLASIVKI